MTEKERWDCGRTLLLESLLKPDDKLRGCAFNQGCYDDLMEIREQVIELVRDMPNPHTIEVSTTMTPNGEISNTLLSGALGQYFMNASYKNEATDNPENAGEWTDG